VKKSWIPGWARRGGLVLVTVLIVEYFVLPELSGARSALHRLSAVTPGFLALGLALELVSLTCYSALTRSVLPLPNRPRLWTVLRIDISALGLSHLLPGGGATATALRYRLLTLAGMQPADVITAAAIEGAGAAVMLALVFGAGLLLALPGAADDTYLLLVGAAAGVFLVSGSVAVFLLIRHQVRAVRLVRTAAALVPRADPEAAGRLVDNLASRLRTLAGDSRLLARTCAWAGANWIFDAASLWVFLRAFGPGEGLQWLLVAYGLAGLLALLPFTPGGLGIVEGTLVSVLVGFGTPHTQAILGVITWRLAEFWMPIPLAALAYLSLRTGTLRQHRLPARPLIPRPDPTEAANAVT
jgi:uncharacterized membrane protein YbhN (UPF0104 family)